jgi:hypothetical protein
MNCTPKNEYTIWDKRIEHSLGMGAKILGRRNKRVGK